MDLPDKLSAAVTELSRLHARVAVAIDGPDVAGKTTLADHLARALNTPQMPVVRASVDGFHQTREQRYERGELSPEGYYADSFDYPRLLDECLLPFLGGASQVRTTAYDHRVDAQEKARATAVPSSAVLVDNEHTEATLIERWAIPG